MTENLELNYDISCFVNELEQLGFDITFWKLVYTVSSNEIITLSKEDDKKIEFRFNDYCYNKSSCSRLEGIILSYSSLLSKRDDTVYQYPWSLQKDRWLGTKSIDDKCSYCDFQGNTCPYKMAAYIKWVCKGCLLNEEEVYKRVIGAEYKTKPEIPDKVEIEAIPYDEIKGLDILSVIAAFYLIKEELVRILPANETMFRYSYVPLCEYTTDSSIQKVYEHIIGKDIQFAFFRKDRIYNEACTDRGCKKCLFTQCPDRVAAYLLFLSSKHNIEVSKLVRFIINKNKYNKVSLYGHYKLKKFQMRISELPLEKQSRKLFGEILNYIVNMYSSNNNKIPHLRFNQVLYTSDEKLADDVVALLKDVMTYFAYYDSSPELLELKYSKTNDVGKIVNILNQIKKPTIVYLKEFDLYLTNESVLIQKNKKESIARIKNAVNDNPNITLILSGDKKELDPSLSMYKDFHEGLLQYHIYLTDFKASKVTELIINALRSYEFEDGFAGALDAYVQGRYLSSDLKSKAFIDKTVNDIIFNHYKKTLDAPSMMLVSDIPNAVEKRNREKIWDEINMLIGLDGVKQEIAMLEKLLEFQKVKTEVSNSKSSSMPGLHMVFSGNPGTGKTTVARLMAEILYNLGFIKKNKVVEVSAKDMIGQHVGHTAPLTAAKCESAYGGVLFIDEAYTLAPGTNGTNNDAFKDECISELIKQMEDHRNELVVILAGYSEPMKQMLDKANPGLRSRISKIIEFEDYTTEQLGEIFLSLVYNDNMLLSANFMDSLYKVIDTEKEKQGFGNARAIRSLYENILQNHAVNVFGETDKDTVLTITERDIP